LRFIVFPFMLDTANALNGDGAVDQDAKRRAEAIATLSEVDDLPADFTLHLGLLRVSSISSHCDGRQT